MVIRFETVPRSANKTGTGFFYLPDNSRMNIRQKVKIWVKLENVSFQFFARVVSGNNKNGIYIPKEFMKRYELLNRKLRLKIYEVSGFYSKIGKDGRIYIPINVANDLKLKNKDIVLIKTTHGKNVYEKFSCINTRKRENRTEYICFFNKKFYKKILLFDLKKIDNRKGSSELLKNISDKINYSFLDKTYAIVFQHRVPAVINTNLNYTDLALYLGAYFSDGTKKGYAWGICASSFEQAKFYLKMHKNLIKDTNFKLTLSFTNSRKLNKFQIENLRKLWEEKIDEKIHSLRIRNPKGRVSAKTNYYGTLVIREGRQVILNYYNGILNSLLKMINIKKHDGLALDFVLGVLEGDGSVGHNRGHVIITTNKKEFDTLKTVLPVSRLKFNATEEKSGKYYIRIGALEILRNFDRLKDKIFVLYPKRRKMLFERLQTVGAVKFLLWRKHRPTAWVKAWLRENDFVDDDYKMTKKGRKLRNDLMKSIRNVTVR